MINSAKYAFVIIVERRKIKTSYQYSKSTNLHVGSFVETKQKANTFNVMGATAFYYKANSAMDQYLLMLVLKAVQCCLGWNRILF